MSTKLCTDIQAATDGVQPIQNQKYNIVALPSAIHPGTFVLGPHNINEPGSSVLHQPAWVADRLVVTKKCGSSPCTLTNID